MKTILFTDNLNPDLTGLENVTLGIIGDQEFPQDGIKRVPALKLVKAMKQMTNKEDYCVMGDPKFVEAGKRLGFKTEEVKEVEEVKIEPPKEEISEGELVSIAARLHAIDRKYGDARKLEEDLTKKHQEELEAEREKFKAEIKRIKKYIRKVINE